MDKTKLFQSYLDICNKALHANRARFPFKQIIEAAQHDKASQNVEVCIVDENPEASFVITMQDGAIRGVPHECEDHCPCDARWRVSKKYLEGVVKNPQIYIDNPARIDWEWLYTSH